MQSDGLTWHHPTIIPVSTALQQNWMSRMSRRRDPQAKVERPGHTQSDLFFVRFARLGRRRRRRHHHHHHHRVCVPDVSPSCAFSVSAAALALLGGIRKKK